MSEQNITFGIASETSSASPLSFTVGQLTDAVRLSNKLGEKEKDQITKWSEDTYGDIWNQLSDLLDIVAPAHLVDSWVTFIDIVTLLMN